MIELFKPISTPIIWILVLLVSGLFLTRNLRKNKGARLGWYLLLSGTLFLILFSNRVISNGLISLLESLCEPVSVEALSELDIVVILSGGVRRPGRFDKDFRVTSTTLSRIYEGIDAFKRSNAKRLVLSGAGSSSRTRQDSQKDGEAMKNLAVRLGVAEDKIIVEANSLNTAEHAIELAKLFPPEKEPKIGLVTSALHMPRSKRAFSTKFQPDDIVPIPVDYTYSSLKFNIKNLTPSAGAFSKSTYAFHELIGILWLLIRY